MNKITFMLLGMLALSSCTPAPSESQAEIAKTLKEISNEFNRLNTNLEKEYTCQE